MTALEVTETLGASLGTAQLVLSCVSQPMLADEPRERVAARDQAAGDAEDVPGVPDGEPMIVIDSPLEGETVLVASVTFSVKNMPEWEQSCVVCPRTQSMPALAIPALARARTAYMAGACTVIQGDEATKNRSHSHKHESTGQCVPRHYRQRPPGSRRHGGKQGANASGSRSQPLRAPLRALLAHAPRPPPPCG